MPPSAKDVLQQDEREFSEFLDLVRGASVIEIGSRAGNSLRSIARRMPKGSRVVSVDNCFDTSFATHSMEPALRENLATLGGYDVHILVGDSRDPEIIAKARELGPFDLCFIDGGHDLDTVTSDWKHYGHMAKVVAFHDLRMTSVRIVWDALPEHFRKKEIVYSDRMGIGVVWRDESAFAKDLACVEGEHGCRLVCDGLVCQGTCSWLLAHSLSAERAA